MGATGERLPVGAGVGLVDVVGADGGVAGVGVTVGDRGLVGSGSGLLVGSGRDSAVALRDRFGEIIDPDGAVKLGGCGQGLGGVSGRRRFVVGGRRVGGVKVCSAAHGCPVHSPGRCGGRLRVLEWLAGEVLGGGGAVVGFPVFVPHLWTPLVDGVGVVETAVRNVMRKRPSRGLPGRWGRRFASFDLAGFAVVLEVVYSPVSGWNAHGHGHAFLRSGDRGELEGFVDLVSEAVKSEVAGVSMEMTDGFYRGRADEYGRRAMIVQSVDEGSDLLKWGYFSIAHPDHPENPGSRFFDSMRRLQADRAADHFDFGPDDRPALNRGDAKYLAWMDPKPVDAQGRRSWHSDDRVWHAAVDGWFREWDESGRAGVPPKPFELVRDIGGLVLGGSATAADLYREAVLGLNGPPGKNGTPKFLLSRGLLKEFVPPPSVTEWAPPENDGTLSVFISNEVCSGVEGFRRDSLSGLDVMRLVEELLADGAVSDAKDLIESVTGRGVEVTGEGDDLVVEFSR